MNVSPDQPEAPKSETALTLVERWSMVFGVAVGIIALFGIWYSLSPSQPEIDDCEAQIVAKLRSPSTYKRVRADSLIMSDQSPPEIWATVEYDAANAYGTPIRDHQICRYPIVDGRADTAHPINDDAPLALSEGGDETFDIDAVAPVTAEATDKDLADPTPTKSEGPSEDLDGYTTLDDTGTPIDMCYKDYCPCEPPQDGMDSLLCDQLEERREVSIDMMIAGRGMREARRQMDEINMSQGASAE